MRTVVPVPRDDHPPLRASRSSFVCVLLEVLTTPTGRYHGRTLIRPSPPACATPRNQRCLHTRMFGNQMRASRRLLMAALGPHRPGDHTSFVQEVPRDLQCLPMVFGHLCRGRSIHTSGHSDLGILSNLGASSNFTRVYADTASAAYPSQPGNLAVTSIIFAGTQTSLFNEHCIGSRVVFYNVSPEHDSAFVLLKCGL